MSNAEREPDRQLREMISKAVIRPGFRVESNNEIETMLDALEGDPFSDEVIDRIVRKARGDLTIGPKQSVSDIGSGASVQEQELLALHRSGGEDIPDDIRQKLDELRRKAQEADKDNDGTSDDVET
jgi:hypothetical protein